MSQAVSLTLGLVAGLGLDVMLGEPRRAHPLVGFGRLAQTLEGFANRPGLQRLLRPLGLLCWLLLVLPPAVLLLWPLPAPWALLRDAVALYFALGARSLGEHGWQVLLALRDGSLEEARQRVSRIVSRDCSALDDSGVSAACCESLLENGNDAVFATLFWFAVGGAAGAVGFRLANTLDAMWGYRTPRFERFGWAAARLDDLLNYLPARLTALSYALCGQTRRALRCWHRQAPQWSSPNAGPVMAAGAGSLGIELGGPARYHGSVEQRPPLGEGRPAEPEDIEGALDLLARALVLWLVALVALQWVVHGAVF